MPQPVYDELLCAEESKLEPQFEVPEVLFSLKSFVQVIVAEIPEMDFNSRNLTLTRFWRVGEEKFETIETGGFYEQISPDLYKRIQATSSSTI